MFSSLERKDACAKEGVVGGPLPSSESMPRSLEEGETRRPSRLESADPLRPKNRIDRFPGIFGTPRRGDNSACALSLQSLTHVGPHERPLTLRTDHGGYVDGAPKRDHKDPQGPRVRPVTDGELHVTMISGSGSREKKRGNKNHSSHSPGSPESSKQRQTQATKYKQEKETVPWKNRSFVGFPSVSFAMVGLVVPLIQQVHH